MSIRWRNEGKTVADAKADWSSACMPNSDLMETITMQFLRATSTAALVSAFRDDCPCVRAARAGKTAAA